MRPSELRKMVKKKFGQKQNKQITVGVTVCFNGCQTSNVWRQNTSCGNPIRTCFFCPVSMLRCKQRYCCLRISTYFLRCCTMYVFSLSGQWILKMVKEKGKLKQRKR